MKRNRFRLETVLRVRRIQEDIKLTEMMTARGAVDRATIQGHARTMSYRDTVQAATSENSSSGFLAERGRMGRFLDGVLESQVTVAITTDELSQRRDTWSTAAQRVSALQRLYGRHQDSHRMDELADEVRETDERTTQRRFLSTTSTPVLGENS